MLKFTAWSIWRAMPDINLIPDEWLKIHQGSKKPSMSLKVHGSEYFNVDEVEIIWVLKSAKLEDG